MSDHPILFSAPMIRALLEGRKTQTRRVLKLPTKGEYVRPDMGGWEPSTAGGGGCFTIARDGSKVPTQEVVVIWNQTTGTCIATRWQAGDRLWVRETFQTAMSDNGPCWLYRANSDRVYPEFDGPDEGAGPSFNYEKYPANYSAWAGDVEAGGPWRSPIHMPRWASRLTLIVDGVKVERLKDIGREDAVAEGLIKLELSPGHSAHKMGCDWGFEGDNRHGSPVSSYAALWNSINGAESWDANPWVVAISFRVIKANIDQIEATS